MTDPKSYNRPFSALILSGQLEEFLKARASGDSRAMGLLFQKAFPCLLLYAKAIAPSEAEAEEAVSHSFEKLLLQEESLEKPAGWMFRVIRNHLLNRRMAQKRHHELEAQHYLPRIEQSTVNEAPERLNHDDLWDTVSEILADRDLKILNDYARGFRTDEIATRQGMTAKTVINRKGLIRKKLAVHLSR